jgi:bifunctional DNA-binding transcriptional regulator/antitoxin component of YhaV-PrlF toxin-antitoxin module
MAKKYEYETILIKGTQLGVFAEFPFESAKEFGTRKVIRVKATFDGKMFRMSLLPHGNGTHWLYLKKEIRDAIGKTEGDSVHIIVEKDENLPGIIIPEYLQWLLENDAGMKKRFEKLPYSAKKFWTNYIDEPKSDDGKVSRVNQLFDFLTGRRTE